jgi:hypothetical protein
MGIPPARPRAHKAERITYTVGQPASGRGLGARKRADLPLLIFSNAPSPVARLRHPGIKKAAGDTGRL